MMGLINRMLFATDFSDGAAQTQRYAEYLAQMCKARLDIAHVIEFQPGMDVEYPVNSQYLAYQRKMAEPKLETVVRTLSDAGLNTTGRMLIGMPSEQIIGLAKELDVDLVVVGTLGKTGLAHLLLGSTAERVIGRAPCPVLAVRGAESELLSMRRILIAVDFSDCSLDALEYGIELAKELGASVTILHGLEPVSYGLDFTLPQVFASHRERHGWESQLGELAALIESRGIPARAQLCGGLPADAIVQSAKASQSDLIVMGTHGRRGLSHLFSGSVAESVLRRATCPVLSVKSPKFAPGHRRLTPRAAELQGRI